MGIIGIDMCEEYWVIFWEVLEGIINKILNILGSTLPRSKDTFSLQTCFSDTSIVKYVNWEGIRLIIE